MYVHGYEDLRGGEGEYILVDYFSVFESRYGCLWLLLDFVGYLVVRVLML